MILKFLTLILYALHSLSSSLVASSPSSSSCSKVCGTVFYHHLPFPFGFSSGCQIQLNCTSNGTMVIHDFPIQEINQDSIMVNIQAQCGRSIDTIQTLFGENYAPTSHNGILMQNCTTPLTSCLIPTTMVQTHFELLDCGTKNSSNISCYSEQNQQNQFIIYQNLVQSQCSSFFSSIAVESMGNSNSSSVSLNVQLVQLGWWLTGNCQCSKHANCIKVFSPTEQKQGYRCQCFDGFVGDGYIHGSGCRKGN